jgi:hypothetical protein
MVKILERGETMGDVPTRRPAAEKRYASNLDRVTFSSQPFGAWGHHPWIQHVRVFLPYAHINR